MEIGGTGINTEVHAVEKVISKATPCKLLMDGTAWGNGHCTEGQHRQSRDRLTW